MYEGSRRYLQAAREAGLRRAVVSSSANTAQVLEVTGLAQYVELRVDGVTAREERLPGKPAPDTFLRAAELLGVAPGQAAVFEDALAGVEAGPGGAVRARGRGRPGRPGRGAAGARRRHRGAGPGGAAVTRAPGSGQHPAGTVGAEIFPVEPWVVRETQLDLDLLAQSESVFALSNGHIGLRGNLDEGEPDGIPGTYLNSFYEERPLPYAEAGYGYPEEGQTIVNVTNGKIMRLLVEDEPFDVRYGDLNAHERVLDLRAGTLERHTDWTSPAGKRVLVRSTRLVSFEHRSIAAICYEVEAVERTRVIVQSELVANEEVPAQSERPPGGRGAAPTRSSRSSQDVEQHGVLLVHRTRESGLTDGRRAWTTR